MGRTVEAKLVYGFYVDDDARWSGDRDPDPLPWKGEGGLDDWWQAINGYANPHDDPYGPDGNRRPGVTDEDVNRYHRHLREWMDANPPPWEYEYFGSVYSESTDFFAVRGAELVRAVWGVEPVEPAALVLDSDALLNAGKLTELMAEHGVEMTPMRWYLLALEG